MGNLIGYLPAVLIVAAAAAIIVWRSVLFVKTKGQSACDSCPYSSSCSSRGHCNKK